MYFDCKRTPDFNNIAAVLEKKVPSRPTLFEFFLNDRIYDKLISDIPGAERMSVEQRKTLAFMRAGYDYVIDYAGKFTFPQNEHGFKKTQSLNSSTFSTREGFDDYVKNFRRPRDFDLSEYERTPEYLPAGMKKIIYSPGGVLENVIALVGYENLCMMLYDEPELASDIFEFVGQCLMEYYELAVKRDFIGAIIVNDDWGFNTQTMLSPKDMRKYVFPWAKKYVALAHSEGKYAILHSCGYYGEIIDDVIDDMKFDARHSYEDNIVPVEQAYEDYGGRIAVLGGIDLDFVIQKSPEEVSARAKKMLERTESRGGYALGSGNSIPEYVPDDHYLALIKPALQAFKLS